MLNIQGLFTLNYKNKQSNILYKNTGTEGPMFYKKLLLFEKRIVLAYWENDLLCNTESLFSNG